MIGHFPSLMPDELLYSALARCIARKRLHHRKPAVRELFARSGIAAVVDLPANLDVLLSVIPIGHRLDADQIITRHTLLPYYEVFLPKERASQVRADLRGQGGPRVHSRIGLMAGRLRPPMFLRYCRGCDAQDLAQSRELCWRRLHQLTGVEVCPHHEMFLDDGVGTERNWRPKHLFINPCLARTNSPVRTLDSTNPEHALFRRLATGAETLLRRGKTPKPIDLAWLHNQYVSLLCNRNLATGNGRVDISEVQRLFAARYRKSTLNRLQCGLQDGWLSRLLRTPRGVQSPLRHLLMWDFLDLEPSSLLDGEEVSRFGAPPFPCLNPVCPERGRLVINQYTVRHCRERHAPIAIMLCPICGYDYRRSGPDPGAVRRWEAPDWIAGYGPLWRQRLAQLWADLNTSLREMARILGVDPITVKRQADKAGLPFPRAGSWHVTRGKAIYDSKNKSGMISNTATEDRREQWVALRAQYPFENRTSLRSRAPAVWTSLYRRDRIWLEANSPRQQKPTPAKTCVDWTARDDSLRRGIGSATARLRMAGNPVVRLTFAALAREVGAIALLQKHPHRLPLTVRAINLVVESREQFALRRLDAVVAACHARCEQPAPWRLIKLTGLRPDLCALASVHHAIDAAVRLLAEPGARPSAMLVAA